MTKLETLSQLKTLNKPSSASGPGALNQPLSMKPFLQSVKSAPQPAELPKPTSVLDQIAKQWEQLNSRLQTRIAQLNGPGRDLIQLQSDVNSINLRTQAVTQIGESVSTTVKRLAQLGGN